MAKHSIPAGQMTDKHEVDEEVYVLLGILHWFVVFVIVWIAMGSEYEFHGIVWGWLPAAIIGIVIGAIWPLVWIGLAILFLFAAA